MDEGAGSTEITVGQLLKEARSAKSLTVEAAAISSKVPLYLVRLMEEEQFHLLPDPFYVMRFLLEYSGALGLDPKQVETRFRRQVHLPRSSAPLQPLASIGSRIQLRRLLLYLLPAAAAAPLILIMLSLFSGRAPDLPPPREPQSPPLQEVASPPAQVGQTPSTSPQGVSPGAERPAREQPTQPVTAPDVLAPRSQPSRYTLRAEAKETAWLAVSVDGTARREVVLQAGSAAEWSANKGFVVTIGNARGIALSLNGKLVPLTGDRNRVIQDLTLPGDGKPGMTR
ncbi:MAG: DUF4115 domain-containing protein [Acidobacteria bacterium]|nr:DUF4115 domain-containing protein [Acidobacteriota bacterium]